MTPPCRLRPTRDAQVTCRTCGQTFAPDAIRLLSLQRVEGGSAPDQSSIRATVGVPCPQGAAAPTHLHLGYGPTAAPRDGELLLALDPPGSTTGRASCTPA